MKPVAKVTCVGKEKEKSMPFGDHNGSLQVEPEVARCTCVGCCVSPISTTPLTLSIAFVAACDLLHSVYHHVNYVAASICC